MEVASLDVGAELTVAPVAVVVMVEAAVVAARGPQ